MLTPSHPMIARFIERGDWAPLADFLTDQGAAAEDLAVLYAGTPPRHVDGIGRECLALWLECRGDIEQAKAVRYFELREHKDGALHYWYAWPPPEPANEGARWPGALRPWPQPHLTPERARRALMRCVLSLPWAERVRVRMANRQYIAPDQREYEGYFREKILKGFPPSAEVRWRREPQFAPGRRDTIMLEGRCTLAAPELVWPDQP